MVSALRGLQSPDSPAGTDLEPVVIAPVLPGHAADDGSVAPVAPDWDDNLASVVSRLQGALADAGATAPVHLVGYSLGARVALGVALEAPEKIARLTLIGVHPGLATEDERRARRASDQTWIDLLLQGGIEAFVGEWENHPVFASQAELPAEVRAAQRRIRLSHTAAGLADSLQCMGLGRMPCYRDRVAELAMPVTLVTGERDDRFSLLADQLAGQIRDPISWTGQNDAACQRITVPGCGHNPVLEQPGAIARLLARDPSHGHAGDPERPGAS